MKEGSADRYFQDREEEASKLVPEGVEGACRLRVHYPIWFSNWSVAFGPAWAWWAQKIWPTSVKEPNLCVLLLRVSSNPIRIRCR